MLRMFTGNSANGDEFSDTEDAIMVQDLQAADSLMKERLRSANLLLIKGGALTGSDKFDDG